MRTSIVEILRQPEYTGENRCEPCTVLNLVIATLLGSVLARKSKIGGGIAFGVSIGLIYLRGYLVPGTPTLTKRYLPPEVLDWFGKESELDVHSGLNAVETTTPNSNAAKTLVEDGRGDEKGETDGDTLSVAPEAHFLEHEIVEPCESTDDLCLSDTFQTAWSEEIDRIDTDEVSGEDAATAFGFDATDEDYEIEYYDDARVLRHEITVVGKWPSQAALVSDVTAARILQSWDSEWESYTPEEKGHLLTSLRLFLETCPTSDGEVVLGEETVESCCQSHEVIAATCTETNVRLFEYPAADLGA